MVVATLFGCSSSEKPEYQLTDGLLHHLADGDRNTYTVTSAGAIGNSSEVYTETIESQQMFAPDNSTITVYTDSFTITGGLILPFVSRVMTYDENDNLILAGIRRSGITYWLMNDNDPTDFGAQLFPADLDTFQDVDIVSDLKYCENQVCETRGRIEIHIALEGKETARPGYANFESYKLALEWSLSLFDTDNATNSINQTLSSGSKQWIHPAVGVVKFVYRIQNDTQSD